MEDIKRVQIYKNIYRGKLSSKRNYNGRQLQLAVNEHATITAEERK